MKAASVPAGGFAPEEPLKWLSERLGELKGFDGGQPETARGLARAFVDRAVAGALAAPTPSGRVRIARETLDIAREMALEPYAPLRRYLLQLVAWGLVDRKDSHDNANAWLLWAHDNRLNPEPGSNDRDESWRIQWRDDLLAQVLSLDPECVYQTERMLFAIRLLKQEMAKSLANLAASPAWQEPLSEVLKVVAKVPERFPESAQAIAAERLMDQRLQDRALDTRRTRTMGL